MDNFTPIKTGKISDLVAEELKSAILNGTFVTGDKLPSQRELAKRFKVSPISIREALKNLEASGLLKMKHGSGVFVAEIDSKSMSDCLFSILHIKRTTISELTEARTILEPTIARIAAERITPAEISELEQNIEETKALLKSNPHFASIKNIEFHAIISKATSNTIIGLTMQTLLTVLSQMTLERGSEISERKATTSEAVKSHEDILGAIKEQNAEKVYQLMLKHIGEIQADFKKIEA